MKLFLKIFIAMVLIALLALGGVFIYQTIKGRGDEAKALEYLQECYGNYENSLDEFTVSYSYKTEEKDGSQKVTTTTKCIIRYENKTKKVITINSDDYGKVTSINYVEYEVGDASVIKRNYGTYTKGKTSFSEMTISVAEYESECQTHPEIVMKRTIDKINDFVSKKDRPSDYGETECKIELSTNVFTQKKAINLEFSNNETIDKIWEKNEHFGVVTIKNNKLLEYKYKYDKVYSGTGISGENHLTESAAYTYEKVPFNADDIYDEYLGSKD